VFFDVYWQELIKAVVTKKTILEYPK